METMLPPAPPDDPLTSFFWEASRRHELHIQRCQACGTYIHMPRPICRNCQSFDLTGERVSGRGTLYSWTQTFKPFHPFFVERVPYVIATITLIEQDGLQFMSNLVGIDPANVDTEAKMGMDVEVTFEDLGEGYIVPMFKPLGAEL